jgi:hypothetical protein
MSSTSASERAGSSPVGGGASDFGGFDQNGAVALWSLSSMPAAFAGGINLENA